MATRKRKASISKQGGDAHQLVLKLVAACEDCQLANRMAPDDVSFSVDGIPMCMECDRAFLFHRFNVYSADSVEGRMQRAFIQPSLDRITEKFGPADETALKARVANAIAQFEEQNAAKKQKAAAKQEEDEKKKAQRKAKTAATKKKKSDAAARELLVKTAVDVLTDKAIPALSAVTKKSLVAKETVQRAIAECRTHLATAEMYLKTAPDA